MSFRIFSRPFLIEKGLNGDGQFLPVPAGHVYVIKQLSAYGNSTAASINVFFHIGDSKCAVWHHNVEGTTASFGSLYGAIALEAGTPFGFFVDAAPADAADCFAGGYDLLLDV